MKIITTKDLVVASVALVIASVMDVGATRGYGGSSVTDNYRSQSQRHVSAGKYMPQQDNVGDHAQLDVEEYAPQHRSISQQFQLRNPQIGSKLRAAAKRGDAKAVKLFLQKGADSDSESCDAALMDAVANGHTEAVKHLLDKRISGANPNAVDDFGNTPISLARKNGHSEIVGLLNDRVQRGEDKRIAWRQSKTKFVQPDVPVTEQLMKACSADDAIEIQRIIDSGVHPDTIVDENVPLLMHAVVNGKVNALKCLLDNKADPKFRDYAGWTALAFAVSYAYDEMAGGSPREADKYMEIIKDLLAAGADPTMVDNRGDTPRDNIRIRSANEHQNKAKFEKLSRILEGAEKRYISQQS